MSPAVPAAPGRRRTTPKSAAADAVVAMMQTRALVTEPIDAPGAGAASLPRRPIWRTRASFPAFFLVGRIRCRSSIARSTKRLIKRLDRNASDRSGRFASALQLPKPTAARAILAAVTTRVRGSPRSKRQAQAAENTEMSGRWPLLLRYAEGRGLWRRNASDAARQQS